MDILAKMSFGTRARMQAWRQIAGMLKNRVKLADAVKMLRNQAEQRKSPRARIYSSILRAIGQGQTLGQALSGGIASREEVLLIGSSQESKRLQEGLMLAAKVLDARGKIMGNLVDSLTYPLTLFILVIVLMVIVATQVMPQLAMISNPDDWKGALRFLYLQSMFVTSWAGTTLLVGFLVILALVAFSFQHWTGPWRRIADKYIPWSVYRLIVGTLWLYAVATRMSTGHQISQILESMAQDPETSPYLKDVLRRILEHSRKGEDFAKALKASGTNFPSLEIVDLLSIYSMMRDFQHHIIQLADDWLEEGRESVQRLVAKVRALALMLVVLELCSVVFAINELQGQWASMTNM